MSSKTLRTVRKDLTVLTSIALLGLVALAALSGMGMDDEAEGILPVDDIHALIGYTMALVAGLHVVLQFGALRAYTRKRWRDLAGDTVRPGSANRSANDEVTT